MDLNEVLVFIKVVQSGSFSGAAKKLAMPVSTVSFKVSSLEKRLGLTLIQRTTRKLKITPVGDAYYKKCVEGLASIEAAEMEVASIQGEPSGLLRVTVFYELASSVLPVIISEFTKKYPKVRVEVLITDRIVDLISENVDLAIRAGELKDSGLIAKKIGASCFGLFASPKYIKAQGLPSHPRELHKHQCLQFTPIGIEEWRLVGPTGSFNAALKGRILMNTLSGLKTMALMGDGIANLPTYYVNNEVKEKKLIRVLPDWRSTLSPTHFVYPGQKFVSPSLTAFMSSAMAVLKESFIAL
jgi:DNA-binding transcriptional LysR family regulator